MPIPQNSLRNMLDTETNAVKIQLNIRHSKKITSFMKHFHPNRTLFNNLSQLNTSPQRYIHKDNTINNAFKLMSHGINTDVDIKLAVSFRQQQIEYYTIQIKTLRETLLNYYEVCIASAVCVKPESRQNYVLAESCRRK